MGCYEFKSLLPDNATDLELALEQTLRQKYCAVDTQLVQKLSDPWQCPLAFLPWLAFAESVDVWNDRWPEATQRAVIANAQTLHRRKGTPGGVRDALAALGVRMSMVSWQDQEPEGEVGTARFELWVNDNINPDSPVMVDSLMIRDMVQTIQRNKRLSVHFTMTLGAELTSTATLAASSHMATRMAWDSPINRAHINAQPSPAVMASSIHAASHSHWDTHHTRTRLNSLSRWCSGFSVQALTLTHIDLTGGAA